MATSSGFAPIPVYTRVIGSFSPMTKVAKRVWSEQHPSTVLASNNLPKMTSAMVQALQVLTEEYSDRDLAEMYDNGVLEDTLFGNERFQKILTGEGTDSNTTSLWDVWFELFSESARMQVARFEDVPIAKADVIGLEISFDPADPLIADLIQQYKFNLITEIDNATRETIRELIGQVPTQDLSMQDAGRRIRENIGLHSRQQRAVENYRAALEGGRYREAKDRALRDRRFDRSLDNAIARDKTLPQDRIDRMVQRYSERQLKYRSEMISRTETIRAANAGQQAMWTEAQRKGLLPPDTGKIWIVSGDERTCPICQAIPGDNPDPIPFDGSFTTEVGPLEHPPAHPNCRCTTASAKMEKKWTLPKPKGGESAQDTWRRGGQQYIAASLPFMAQRIARLRQGDAVPLTDFQRPSDRVSQDMVTSLRLDEDVWEELPENALSEMIEDWLLEHVWRTKFPKPKQRKKLTALVREELGN